MKYYIYRLSGQNTSTNDHTFGNLRKRGLGGLIPEDHPHRLEYMSKFPDYQTLYIETVEVLYPHQVNDWDVIWTRDFSISHNAYTYLVNRLLTVRSEWSRK